MKNIIDWCLANKEWVFSGIGPYIIAGVIAIFGFFIRKNNSYIQKAGKNSIQVSNINGNVSINNERKRGGNGNK